MFWRDPSIGLIGLYAHQTRYVLSDPADLRITNERMALEGEYYLDNWTFKGLVGKHKLTTNAFSNTETFDVTKGEINFYLNENFVVSAGISHSFETTATTVGFEAMAPVGGFSPSVFANARFSDDDQTVMAGLTLSGKDLQIAQGAAS